MATPFRQHLRETARPVWEAIFAHPFVQELGAGTLSRALPADALYAEWIQAYSAEGFGAHVEQQLQLVDRLAVSGSPAERERMQEHFVQSSRYEYLFWEQAYRQEDWLV